MSSNDDGEYPFFLNQNRCAIYIEEEILVIKSNPLDSTKSDESSTTQQSTKNIAFSEILKVKYLDPKNSSKRRPSLSIKHKIKLPHILIKTIKRCKDCRWKLFTIKLKSQKHFLCQKWAKNLEEKLEKYSGLRPKVLLIFINPYGGSGTARNVYDKKVKHIFEEAEIKTVVVTTSFRHHAKTYIETHDLSQYDGIIGIGGDGILNEIVNGIISQTQSQNGISLHTKKGDPRSCPKYQRPEMKVGIIPAGSTDCVSYVTQGINDPETSALHIVLGDSHPVDVVSLHNSDGIFQQFSMSLTGYGYFGDMLRHSESLRWMGPPRYTLVGANVFLRNKSYSGEVHYLPAAGDEDPAKSSFCRSPCPTCQDGLADSDSSLFTPITPNVSFADALTFEASTELESGMEKSVFVGTENREDLHDASHTDTYIHTDGTVDSMQKMSTEDGPCDPDVPGILVTDVGAQELSSKDGLQDGNEADQISDHNSLNGLVMDIDETSRDDNFSESPEGDSQIENVDEESKEDLLMTDRVDETGDVPADRPKTLGILQATEQNDKTVEEWKVIKGDFMSVNGVAMSCACERSPLGLSPYCHLCDGAIDLIVVKACSRFEFLRFLISHTGKGDRFDFPYVEVHRVKAFQFIPSASQKPPAMLEAPIPSPGSISSASGGESTVHISLDDLSVKYKRTGKKTKKKKLREMKRSQSMVVSNPVSTWNSDGEIVEDPNMTVRVHRGLILMFCRGVEDLET